MNIHLSFLDSNSQFVFQVEKAQNKNMRSNFSSHNGEVKTIFTEFSKNTRRYSTRLYFIGCFIYCLNGIYFKSLEDIIHIWHSHRILYSIIFLIEAINKTKCTFKRNMYLNHLEIIKIIDQVFFHWSQIIVMLLWYSFPGSLWCVY